ncbi:Rpp20 subunit of nuclear RNase MRP and P-domain-containing protein [Fusarium flagelliforme]|uniref:Rpp20 subunit of nuclear RNase MRP and P-domain-containing protein n=1 Tax=Fusarium flagelliforme TaxID=2675880 RepID=UPI001E8EE151|nr:Rpp20 subunit of nuclear RNase MRP and P-domain-containing protein [Fusarium flagelliforme]KAH7197946.1 Rpp20 subunit of nuclear RNase MRP and P-domain-containing protein [Fusarium flagelliforme]
MSPNESSTAPRKVYGTLNKLPSISEGSRVEKRPLTRRQPPASSKSRIIYVSSKTPFMAAVKRARKQLDASLKTTDAAPRGAPLHSRVENLKKTAGGAVESAVVTVMGTGKAIEKTLAVAGWFEQEGDCEVEIKTGTVGTVDDVVAEGDEEDETRLRKLGCLEVRIKLK